MSAALSHRRGRRAFALAALGAFALALGLGAVWREARVSHIPEVAGPVLPDWTERARQAAVIEVVYEDRTLRFERAEDGRWRAPAQGGYPVRQAQIAALDAGLASLRFEDALPGRRDAFARLGLAAPGTEGGGVRLTILNTQGEALADLILGEARAGGGLYLREAAGGRAYGVAGDLPDLAEAGDWLDLAFIALEPQTLARAEVRPEVGPAYRLIKAGMSVRNFTLREPRGWSLITVGAADGVATAGARVRFRDVRAAETLTGSPVAAHGLVTFSGLALAFDFYADGAERWAVVRAQALSDDAAPRAAALNAQLDGWAFKVSADGYERMTRPLDQIAEEWS